MNSLHLRLLIATALATGLAVAMPMTAVPAAEDATIPTDPGFNPDTGQINPGRTLQAPSASDHIDRIPTPGEALAAKRMPVSTQPSLGNGLGAEVPHAEAPPRPGLQSEQRESKNAAGGPQGSGANANEPDAAAIALGRKPVPTVGAATHVGDASRAQEPPPSGPIGAVGQTLPAKYSERNDILDRVPIMAWPLALDDKQRRQIYDAVMAEKSPLPAGADALAPASELSTEQALSGMHPLPESVRDIVGVKGLKYVRAKDKVLLVEPSTRIVVGQINA